MKYKAPKSAPLLGGAILLSTFLCRSETGPDLSRTFSKTEVFIPMRDAVRLHTEIYVPKNPHERLPILLLRTPYGIRDVWDPWLDKKGFTTLFNEYHLSELIAEGYVFAFQDIRGRFGSEGQFVMERPPRDKADPKSIDESTDAFDTIDWLVKNVPNNNGRVGIFGDSYDAWLAVMAILDPHPALKGISEAASNADMFIGDDFYHNGAFRLSMDVHYVYDMETSKVVTYINYDKYDQFDWYLNLALLANVDRKYFHGEYPTWNNFIAHPTYDEYWQRQQVPHNLNKVTVPVLNVAGWWDEEDFYGPIKTYETLEKNDFNRMNYLVVGPWNHDGWCDVSGRKLDKIDFRSDTAKYFRENVQTPWFNYWLKDKGKLDLPEALVFQSGTNKWESYDEWPPRKNVPVRKLYFRTSGGLAFDPPPGDEPGAFDSYVSDPARPVPYLPRPITAAGWQTWLVQDQRFADMRPDVLSWETDVLEQDLAVAGDIVAHLFASSSGTDSDWIVKLIDVYPEDCPIDPTMGGYQLMIASEIFRAKFRESFEKPKPVVPDQVTEYTIDLHTNDHVFLKGHRMMVQVQSTWFPVYDRNPQKYVENIFTATEADYHKATQRVFRSKRYPSNVDIPLAPR